jgi:hypothetical protein
MKKLAALFALCLTAMTAGAQDWSGTYQVGKLYEGYYVANTGDTVRGFIRHGNRYDNQVKCLYYRQELDTKPTATFKPEEISSYKVADKVYRAIHYSGGLLEKPVRFNLVTKDGGGGITEFQFFDEDGTKNADGTPHYTVVYFKPNDPANPKPMSMQDFGLGFAKKMAAFVADNEELSKKVADKEKGYGMIQIDKIIAEYNTWYAANH